MMCKAHVATWYNYIIYQHGNEYNISCVVAILQYQNQVVCHYHLLLLCQ